MNVQFSTELYFCLAAGLLVCYAFKNQDQKVSYVAKNHFPRPSDLPESLIYNWTELKLEEGKVLQGSQSSYPSWKSQTGVFSSFKIPASYPIKLKAILNVEQGLIRFWICGPISITISLVRPLIRRKFSSAEKTGKTHNQTTSVENILISPGVYLIGREKNPLNFV